MPLIPLATFVRQTRCETVPVAAAKDAAGSWKRRRVSFGRRNTQWKQLLLALWMSRTALELGSMMQAPCGAADAPKCCQSLSGHAPATEIV